MISRALAGGLLFGAATAWAGAPTSTFTQTLTQTSTYTRTATHTPTASPTASDTPNGTFTASPTFSVSPTFTPFPTATFTPAPGAADQLLPGLAANGEVRHVLHSGSAIYVAGSFSAIGPATGSAVWIDGSAARQGAFPHFAGGAVHCVAPDGHGGWLVGGAFTHVAGQAQAYLARVFANGVLDTAFRPVLDNRVISVASDGVHVFASGWFDSVNFAAQNRTTKLFLANGQLVPGFSLNLNSYHARAMLIESGSLYLAGSFFTVNGVSRRGLAKVSAVDGALDAAFNADVNHSWTSVEVQALKTIGGSLYAAGAFDSIGGLARQGIAKLDPGTGAGDAAFNVQSDGTVTAVLQDGADLIIGGGFFQLGGVTNARVARVNAASGARIPGLSVSYVGISEITSLLLTPDGLLMGGNFTAVNGQARRNLARVNASTGVVDPGFVANASERVYVLEQGGTGLAVIAGEFASLGCVVRQGLAKVNAVGLAVDPGFNAAVAGSVNCLALSGPDLYLGGSFSTVGGQTRANLAKVDATTGALQTAFLGSAPSTTIESLALDGTGLVVAGSFSLFAGQARSNMARLDAGSGALDPGYAPNPNGWVSAVLAGAGGLFVGGSFSTVSNTPTGSLTKLLSNGAVDPAFAAPVNATVESLALDVATLYAAGSFTVVGGLPRARLAKLDAGNGRLNSAFDAGINAVGRAVASAGDRVYVGGDFSLAGGKLRRRFAALEHGNGAAVAALDIPLPDYPHHIAVAPDGSQVVVGGRFFQAGGRPNAYVAVFNAPLSQPTITPSATPPAFIPPTPTHSPTFGPNQLMDRYVFRPFVNKVLDVPEGIYLGGRISYVGLRTGPALRMNAASAAVEESFPRVAGGEIQKIIPDGQGGWYLAGDFTHVAGLPRAGLARVHSNSAVDPVFRVDLNGLVKDLVVVGEGLYLSGLFTTVNGLARPGIARVDAATGAMDSTFVPYNPAFLIQGAAIAADGTSLYFYSQGPERVVRIDLGTGLPDPAFDCTVVAFGEVDQLIATPQGLYVAGYFTSINATGRLGLAKVNLASGALDPAFNPACIPYPVRALALDGTSLYAAGNTSASYPACPGIVKLDAATGSHDTGFTAAITGGSEVLALAVVGNDLYLGGGFESVNSQPRRRLAKVNKATGGLDGAFATNAEGLFSQAVRAIVQDGPSLVVGGSFVSLGGWDFENLARLDPSTGLIDLGFRPSFGDDIKDMVYGNGSIYAAHQVGNIRKVHPLTGAFDPGFSDPSGGVQLQYGNNSVYVLRYPYGPLRKLDALSGSPDPGFGCTWSFSLQPTVRLTGSDIFVYGYSGFICGQSTGYLAKIDAFTGGMVSQFSATLNGAVGDVQRSGDRLYIGGNFTQVNGVARQGLALLDAQTGETDNFFLPYTHPTPGVRSLAYDGLRVYATGAFSTTGGFPIANFAAFDHDSGGIDTQVSLDSDDAISRSLLVPGPDRMHLLGGFIRIQREPAYQYAMISVRPGAGPTYTFTPSPTVSPSFTVSPTFTASPTFSPSPSQSATATPSPTATETATASATLTLSATPTASPTRTATPTLSPTPTLSVSPTVSPTFSASPTRSESPTFTPTRDRPGARRGQVFSYPNPAVPKRPVTIIFEPAVQAAVSIYDWSGRKVAGLPASAVDAAGGQAAWNVTDDQGRALSSGLYFIVVRTERGAVTRRLTVLRP